MNHALEIAESMVGLLVFKASTLPSMVFFSEINDFLNDEIAEFATNLLGRVARLVGSAAAVITTIWVMFRGFEIVSGRSREPMMGLVARALRATLIVGIAVSASAGAGSTYRLLTDDLNVVVRGAMTGRTDEGPYRDIDRTLGILQAAFEVIDSVDAGDSELVDDAKTRALTLAGVGLGGPAIMSATALLLNKIAMALVVGLGPLFILCLLFEPTKQLFFKWLYYGIGTLFSMAFLTVMTTLALDMVIAVGLSFWLPSSWIGSNTESLTSMAMQQGGLGMILTMLIVTAPPMAAVFFQGMLGSVNPYNVFTQQAAPPGPSSANAAWSLAGRPSERDGSHGAGVVDPARFYLPPRTGPGIAAGSADTAAPANGAGWRGLARADAPLAPGPR